MLSSLFLLLLSSPFCMLFSPPLWYNYNCCFTENTHSFALQICTFTHILTKIHVAHWGIQSERLLDFFCLVACSLKVSSNGPSRLPRVRSFFSKMASSIATWNSRISWHRRTAWWRFAISALLCKLIPQTWRWGAFQEWRLEEILHTWHRRSWPHPDDLVRNDKSAMICVLRFFSELAWFYSSLRVCTCVCVCVSVSVSMWVHVCVCV